MRDFTPGKETEGSAASVGSDCPAADAWIKYRFGERFGSRLILSGSEKFGCAGLLSIHLY